MKLLFASHNAHKAKEIQSLLPNGFELKTLNDVGLLEDIPETGQTLQENASIKNHYVWQKLCLPCFADDTGLEVEALNGEPGVYSARFAGLQKDGNDNMKLLLEKLKDSDNRKARFRTVISYIINGKEFLFEGIIEGRIATEPSGTQGFGYDPLFIPDGSTKTFAEMDLTEKNTYSHRARAFARFIESL